MLDVDNELTTSQIRNNYTKIEHELVKLRKDIYNKDKQIEKLQLDLQMFSKSTNSTSSQFPLSKEFTDQWTFFTQNLLLESFDTIYPNNYLLSKVVQGAIRIIKGQTKIFLKQKILLLLKLLGITEHSEAVVQAFFKKYNKILLQEYYKTCFICTEEMINQIIGLLRDNINGQSNTFNKNEIEDINKDLNATPIKKFIEEAFYICLYMDFHEPPLLFNIPDKPKYYYFSKSDFVNIGGFAKDNTPCLLILSPPMFRTNQPFQGFKAAVYACEEFSVTDDIINQCEEYKGTNKKHVKSFSVEGNQHNQLQSNRSEIDPVKKQKRTNSIMSNDQIAEDMPKDNKKPKINPSFIELNIDPSVNLKKKINNYKNKTKRIEEANLTPLKHGSTSKTKSNHKGTKYQNARTNGKTSHKKSISKEKEEAEFRDGPEYLTNTCSKDRYSNPKNINKTKLKETFLSNTNQLQSKQIQKEKSFTIGVDKSNMINQIKPHLSSQQSLESSYNYNPDVDKSITNSQAEDNNCDSNRFDTSKSLEPPLTTEVKKPKNININDYLKTPILKTKESLSNGNCNESSSKNRHETSNQNSLKHLRFNTNINSIIANNHKKVKNGDSKGSLSSIKKLSSNNNNYLKKKLSSVNGSRDCIKTSQIKTKLIKENQFNSEYNSFSYKNSDNNNDQFNINISNNSYCVKNISNAGEHYHYNGLITHNNIDINNASFNSLRTNNSNIQYIGKISSKPTSNSNTNQFLTTNSNNGSRKSLLYNNKQDHNSGNPQVIYKNNPTTVFNFDKNYDCSSNQITKTEYNTLTNNASTLNNNIQDQISGKTISTNNTKGLMITNDIKFNGLRNIDSSLKKKGSYPGCTSIKKTDNQLTYYSINHHQPNSAYTSSTRADKEKNEQLKNSIKKNTPLSTSGIIPSNIQISAQNNINTKTTTTFLATKIRDLGHQLYHNTNTLSAKHK